MINKNLMKHFDLPPFIVGLFCYNSHVAIKNRQNTN